MQPVENYLQELNQIRAIGASVKELSFYPALKNLLDAAGKELKPKVRSVLSLKNQGAGNPDGGLFTASQFRKLTDDAILDQLPERGAIEVKSPKDDAEATALDKQVAGYLQRYGLVLVTNLRDFVLAQHSANGKAELLERYTLAKDEAAFWQMTSHPRTAANEHGKRLMEFLKRAMLYKAELTEPKDLAWFLASYARDAHTLVDAAGDLPALNSLRQSMQQALNMEFTDERGEHFFRSTLVQTLFYGIFSAWVLWHHETPPPVQPFDWRLSAFKLKVPIIQALFHQISDPAKLKSLGLTEYLDLTGATLNRVQRSAFFAKFDEGQAVQYFYEPFLEAYDPELRKQMGVWYTPTEVVQYMVERVDRVLRTELGVVDGLADPSVYVLDPCCGTGAYPLAVLNRIAKTLKAKGEDSLLGYELKRAATQRVFGFEILPAPFVIAHLQAGLFLHNHDVPLAENERASIYLTNALTGWEPPKGPKQQVAFTEFEQELDAAEHVKRDTPILVIMGNPPYNAFAGVAEGVEEKEQAKTYKAGLIEKWKIKKFNLDDPYVRFFRLAERRIAEISKRGVVCYISNFSYLGDPSYVVMRQRFLEGFDKFWFDCMNGDSRGTGKRTPDGLPDPSVFSTESNHEGIRVGTTIGLMVRKQKQTAKKAVSFRHFWGVNKRADLLASLDESNFEKQYQTSAPTEKNRYSFRPQNIADDYMFWASLPELCVYEPTLGILENRKEALICIDKDKIESRMKAYYDPSIDWDSLKALNLGLTENFARFDAFNARQKILQTENFKQDAFRRVTVRPMDIRWCYYSSVRPLWNEPRPAYHEQCWKGNVALVSRRKGVATPEGVPFYFTSLMGLQHGLYTDAYYFPLRFRKDAKQKKQQGLFETKEQILLKANLSELSRAYLAGLGFLNVDDEKILENELKPYELIWLHALAIGYSPAYLGENADGIRQDYPRIPLPASKDALLKSASLGKQIAALLETESPVSGVTVGDIRKELKEIAELHRIDGKQLNPQQGDFAIDAGWGHAQGNTVMPGQGKIIQRSDALDIYLNDIVYWQNIPVKVWEYTIGGYQVIKKWLSYREKKILGRDISVEEAREVTSMARRISAIIQLEPQLDENYQKVKAETAVLRKLKRAQQLV